MNEVLIVSVVVLVFIFMYIKNFIEKKIDEQFGVYKTVSEVLIERLDSNSTTIKGSYKQFRSDYLKQNELINLHLDNSKKLIIMNREMLNDESLSKKEKKKKIEIHSEKLYDDLDNKIRALVD